MSPAKAIKTFRDLLAFLTIIPMGGKEDFVFTSAENMYLFPIIGGFIGIWQRHTLLAVKLLDPVLTWLSQHCCGFADGFFGNVCSCGNDNRVSFGVDWTAAF